MNDEQMIDLSNMTAEQFRRIYGFNGDVIVFSKRYELKNKFSYGTPTAPLEIIFIMHSFMINNDLMKQTILPSIEATVQETQLSSLDAIMYSPKVSWFCVAAPYSPIMIKKASNYLFEGFILCAIPSLQSIMIINCADIPKRDPMESTSDVSIRGPRDGFVEDIGSNIALIRKRIRNENLVIENYAVGKLTDTKLALLYMRNVANDQLIQTARDRINHINSRETEVLTIGEVEKLIGDKMYLFPTLDYSPRPDFIAQSLLDGRFVVILDNNPMAIIAPGNFFQLLHSPEDNYFPSLSSNIGHLFRLFGLLISIFLPSFYIALSTFHPDQLPLELLATVSLSRLGLPMEAAVEMFLIVSFMELFREATLRMPTHMSQTITVVGGLIMGDAAIRAGLVSPLIVVVAAVSIITGATLINQALTSSVVLYRFIAYLFGAILGIYGVIISYVLFMLLLSRLHSFGVPYLTPLAPLNLRELIVSLFQVGGKTFGRKAPNYLHTKHNNEDENR